MDSILRMRFPAWQTRSLIAANNHCLLERKELRDFLKDNQLADRVLVPEDGERFSFSQAGPQVRFPLRLLTDFQLGFIW
ncbi:hypothetical protein EDM54_05460 [Brevibacillus borstelensis]|nr:hypothetical protein X546_03015 [Brevibacillus borstelensis cifa_chp40]RNB64698.1 hypothetical protein EDM54_05460 [Brevibacillus borstelensis]